MEELKTFTDEELEKRNVESVEKELQAAESHLKAAKPNLSAIAVSFFLNLNHLIFHKKKLTIYFIFYFFFL